jgi:PAS domain S-box-containing protein
MSSLAALRPILKTAIDPVVVMDAKGAILDWSARAEAAFGWSRDEILGRGLVEVLAPLRHQTHYRQILANRLGGSEPPLTRQSSQLMAMRKDGTEIPIEVSLAAFGARTPPCSSASSATSPTGSRSTSGWPPARRGSAPPSGPSMGSCGPTTPRVGWSATSPAGPA